MLNQVQIIGHVGKDPETRYASNGDAICAISVASSERWKDKAGQQQERTEWFRCVAYGRTAEVIGEYVRKGTLIYITGPLQTRSYTDKAGLEKTITEVKVREMKLLPSKRDGEPAEQKAQNDQKEQTEKTPDLGGLDDDIPF